MSVQLRLKRVPTMSYAAVFVFLVLLTMALWTSMIAMYATMAAVCMDFTSALEARANEPGVDEALRLLSPDIGRFVRNVHAIKGGVVMIPAFLTLLFLLATAGPALFNKYAAGAVIGSMIEAVPSAAGNSGLSPDDANANVPHRHED